MADKPPRADKSGKFQNPSEELIEGLEKAMSAFKAKMPSHYQTIQTWPLQRAIPEIVRELRKAD